MVSFSQRGFSLVELLVVIGIMALLLGFGSVALNNVVNSSKMDQAGRQVLDEIALARQTATARNKNVELRLIRKPRTDGSGGNVYWQLQSGIVEATDSTNFSPIKSPASLPAGVALETSTEASPMMGYGSVETNSAPAYQFKRLIFRPSGELERTNVPPVNQPKLWVLTLVPERKLGEPLANQNDFITIQIDPITGRARAFRP